MKKVSSLLAIVIIFLFAQIGQAGDYVYFTKGNNETIRAIAKTYNLQGDVVARNNNCTLDQKLPKGTKVYLYSDPDVETNEIIEVVFDDMIVENQENLVEQKAAQATEEKSEEEFYEKRDPSLFVTDDGKKAIDFEGLLIGGIYNSYNSDQGNSGHYFGAEGRVWLKEMRYGRTRIGIGGFIKGQIVGGTADGYSINGSHWESKYNQKELAFGPSAKWYISKGRDMTFNFGPFMMWNDDKNMSQFTYGLYLAGIYSDSSRRARGKKSFPKMDIVSNFHFPWDSDKKSITGATLNSDNKFGVSAQLWQGVYDFAVNDALSFTPGFFLGAGYDGRGYFRFGPGIEMNVYGKEVLYLGLGPKLRTAGGVNTFGFDASVSTGGIYRAYRDYNINLASEKIIRERYDLGKEE